MLQRKPARVGWSTAPVYLAIVGVALLVLGWGAIIESSEGAATTAFILGGGALIAAPFVPRLEGLRFGPVQLTLREVVIEAVATADPEALAGVPSLLTGSEVSVGRVRLPDRFAGHRLVDQEFRFLRRNLNVSVLGVLEPGETHWQGGARSRSWSRLVAPSCSWQVPRTRWRTSAC